jgi:ribosome-associated heat shock protein Hsp15
VARAAAQATVESQRLDRWLWCARFFKSRSIATKLCQGRKVRINRQLVQKAAASIRVGDVLTFPQARHIRVVKILTLAQRRGPASEAQELYDDLAPPEAAVKAAEKPVSPEAERIGRPTKRDRRALDRLHGRDE